MASFQEAFGKQLAKTTGAQVGTLGKGVPKPMDLYNEAAPRIIRGMQQYDAAAPLIDFATKNWWLIAIAAFGIGVVSSYVGSLAYHKIHRVRANPRRRR